ncbi:MAG: hypothetical protein PHE54_01590 [Bacilli bacterium]|nr:hypothetical protein [Bacilli bacterium]
MKKQIILEIIPTSSNPLQGDIIQLSALKIQDWKIIDRFDYRLQEEKIAFKKLIELINYDKETFVYKNSTEEIMRDFINWIEDCDLLIIDNIYTRDYLKNIANNKISICEMLSFTYHDHIIEDIMIKYNLEPSNYIVDLLYEALIYEKK